MNGRKEDKDGAYRNTESLLARGERKEKKNATAFEWLIPEIKKHKLLQVSTGIFLLTPNVPNCSHKI